MIYCELVLLDFGLFHFKWQQSYKLSYIAAKWYTFTSFWKDYGEKKAMQNLDT